MPPAGCGAGYPITYQRDITLIACSSMVAILTDRLLGAQKQQRVIQAFMTARERATATP
jgi:hypothetical protein